MSSWLLAVVAVGHKKKTKNKTDNRDDINTMKLLSPLPVDFLLPTTPPHLSPSHCCLGVQPSCSCGSNSKGYAAYPPSLPVTDTHAPSLPGPVHDILSIESPTCLLQRTMVVDNLDMFSSFSDGWCVSNVRTVLLRYCRIPNCNLMLVCLQTTNMDSNGCLLD